MHYNKLLFFLPIESSHSTEYEFFCNEFSNQNKCLAVCMGIEEFKLHLEKEHFLPQNKTEIEPKITTKRLDKKEAPMAVELQCVKCPVRLKGKKLYVKHIFQEHLANLEKNGEENVKISCSEYGISCDFSVMTTDLEIFKKHFESHFQTKKAKFDEKKDTSRRCRGHFLFIFVSCS